MIKCSLSDDSTEIKVEFANDPVWNDRIRHIAGRRWSRSQRCWLVPNTRANVVKIGQLFGKENCLFSPDLVKFYKPNATKREVFIASAPKRFANIPNYSELEKHPAVLALVRRMQLTNYAFKSIKNYKLGHTSLETTMRYMHVSGEEAAKRANQIDLLGD